MANKLGQLRVVPKPQREHVAVATEDDGLPPPVVEGFLGDDEMARPDLVPGPGQAGRDRQSGVFEYGQPPFHFEPLRSFRISAAG